MFPKRIEQLLHKIPKLDRAGDAVAHTIHDAVLRGGTGTRTLADMLHGTWLGHPLHPVLTDLTVGGWSLGLLFDLISLGNRTPRSEDIADALTTAGTVAAVPTILSGVADYSTIPQNASGVGLAHSVSNDVAFVLQLTSINARKKGKRGRAIALSGAAMLLATLGAWLGGHLVFDKKVGVNHAESGEEPAEWTPVLDEGSLLPEKPKRVEVAGTPILLYRHGEQIYAVGAVCPHAGAPLEEGDFSDGCVQCPWHDSVFDLVDGTVVHGPSTYPVSSYSVRIRNGQVEVRFAQDDRTALLNSK